MKWLMVVIVGLIAAGQAWADRAPPFPAPGTTWGWPIFRIEVAEAFPEYVFLVIRNSTMPRPRPVPPPLIILAELSPDHPLVLPDTGGYRMGVWIHVVSRQALERYANSADVSKALDEAELPIAASIDHEFTHTAMPLWWGREGTITYRLQRKKSGDGLEIVRSSWDPLFQWYVAVGFFTLAIVWGGIRFGRRMRRVVFVAK